MKIILTAAVSKLGRVGDIIEVKNGYAKNFLIPSKKAICFTVNNAKIFESKKHEFEQANQDSLSKAYSIKEKVVGKNIIVTQNASDDGRLYGSVNGAIIATEINKLLNKDSVTNHDVFLRKPIKEIGIYDVVLAPHSEVSFEVKVIVSRSEAEAEAMLKGEDKKGKKGTKVEASAEESLVAEAVEGEAGEEPKVAKKRAPRKKKEEAAE